MSVYKYIRNIWKKPEKTRQKERLMQWRREPSTVKIDKPTRLDRARSLGYKAKQGIFIVRQAVPRGGHQRPDDMAGRRPKTQRRKLSLRKNYKLIAEERASKKFSNCEVLNSYWVGQDGNIIWHEVILVDGHHPRIRESKDFSWVKHDKGRVNRGKTSAGKKVRGLHKKGKGVEKSRPGRRANNRKL
ncbi:MAG: 50S ribosomal protein L15e [Nanobdellota archaeon]